MTPLFLRARYLAGGAAPETRDAKQSIADRQARLPRVEPGSGIGQLLRQGIAIPRQGR